MRPKHRLITITSFVLVIFSIASGWAAEGDRKWGMSPYIGLYEPSLKLLNKGEFRSPYQGTADLIDLFGNNNNVTVPLIFRAPLPALNPGPITGLDFIWRINDKHDLLIGGGDWQSISSTSNPGVFPVQGAFESVIAQRKGNISFTEFHLGWRYNVVRKPNDHDFYLTFSIHDVFDVRYREDFSLLFLSGPPRSFRKSSIIESRATGLLLLQGTGGGEWFINDWFSISAEAGYVFGLKPLKLGNGNLNTDFRSTDNLFLELPIIQNASGTMQYKTENGAGYRDLKLSFEGWKALIKATIYY